MDSSLTALLSLINQLKKDVLSWNSLRVSFATALQEWDSTSQADMDMIMNASSSLFPVKDPNYASSAYDIRESIMQKGIKTVKSLELIRKSTEDALSSIYELLGKQLEDMHI